MKTADSLRGSTGGDGLVSGRRKEVVGVGMIHDTAIVPALARLGMRYLEEPERSIVVVPVAPPSSDSGVLLLQIEARDEEGMAVVGTQLCRVPTSTRTRVALLLAELNTRFSFITFSMTREDAVAVDTCVEFVGVAPPDHEATLGRAILRLLNAIRQAVEPIASAARPKGKGRRQRLEREIDVIMSQFDS